MVNLEKEKKEQVCILGGGGGGVGNIGTFTYITHRHTILGARKMIESMIKLEKEKKAILYPWLGVLSKICDMAKVTLLLTTVICQVILNVNCLQKSFLFFYINKKQKLRVVYLKSLNNFLA